MQAAALVNVTATPRSKADSASANTQKGGKGADAFAALLNQAGERGEGSEPGAEGSALSQQTIPRAGKVGKPIQERLNPKKDVPAEPADLAKALPDVALRGNAKDAAEESAESPMEGVESTAESLDGAEVDPEKVGNEVHAHPELLAWLAGVLPAPAAAQEAAQGKPLQQADAASAATSIQVRLAKELKLAAKGEKAAEAADKLKASNSSSTGLERPEGALIAQPLTAARSKPAGTPTSDGAPRASTPPAPADSGASITPVLAKPMSSEAAASQPQASAPVLGTQGFRENSPTTPQATATRSEAVIQPSVHSPAFAPAFSARIATLARDGLELARVHLNPVDMGPVSVQLSLEGQQVRVDMTADVAATRRVLEQALPTLAGALREAGFTLSGGGVHQPPTDARQSSSQDAGANSSSNPQGAGTPDNLSSSAGGAGGQGSAANPFREDPQNRGAFTNSRQLTVGEDGALSANGTSSSLEGRPATGLVDVFA